MENTRYARVFYSKQWSNYNINTNVELNLIALNMYVCTYRSRDSSVELDGGFLPRGRSPSPAVTWNHVTLDDPRGGPYSPHAMSEPGSAPADRRGVTSSYDVMAGAPPRGGSFDLSEIRHHHHGDADAGVLLVDPAGALLHHEFSPPSPAPQDAVSYTPCPALVDR